LTPILEATQRLPDILPRPTIHPSSGHSLVIFRIIRNQREKWENGPPATTMMS